MPKLDHQRVHDAIDKAYDAEVANLFKTLIENLIEVASGASGGGLTRNDQCVGTFARSMKRLSFAYDKACDVAKQIARPLMPGSNQQQIAWAAKRGNQWMIALRPS